MDLGAVTSLFASQQSVTRQALSLSMIKQQHEMDMSMANMLADAVKSVPPAGQGTSVDKTA